MFYGDTSLLVSALTNEASTEAAQAWPARHSVATSGWTDVEFCNAVAMKQRIGKLTADAATRVLASWDRLRSGLTQLPISSRHYAAAALLIGRSTSGLRSGDALHAALAVDGGYVLATFDRGLLRACAELAIPAADSTAG